MIASRRPSSSRATALQRFESRFELRDYQQDNNEKLREALQVYDRVLMQQPTGTGKSIQILHIACKNIARGLQPLILVPNLELIKNLERYFLLLGIVPGIIQASRATNYKADVIIASVPTLARRINDVSELNPDFLIWDESHHLKAKGWVKIAKAFFHLPQMGFTATPKRLDGEGFDDIFEHLITSPSIGWFIRNKHLAPFQYYSKPGVIYHFDKQGGDYRLDQQSEALDNPTITGDAVETWKRETLGQKTIVFCSSNDHADHVAEAYNIFGRAYYGREIAASVDYKTPEKEKEKIYERFKSDDLLVVTNVDMLSEGVDFPGAYVVQFLRMTASLARFLQMVGRVLRLDPDNPEKIATILDHVGMLSPDLHGLPDQDYPWSLIGEKKEREQKAYELYCPSCETLLSKDYRRLRDIAEESILLCDCGAIVEIPKVRSRGERKGYERETGELIKGDLTALQFKINSIVAKSIQKHWKPFASVARVCRMSGLTYDDFLYLCKLTKRDRAEAAKLFRPYFAIYYGNFKGLKEDFAEHTKLTGKKNQFLLDFFWKLQEDVNGDNIPF